MEAYSRSHDMLRCILASATAIGNREINKHSEVKEKEKEEGRALIEGREAPTEVLGQETEPSAGIWPSLFL